MFALAGYGIWKHLKQTECEWISLHDDNFNVSSILETDKQDD